VIAARGASPLISRLTYSDRPASAIRARDVRAADLQEELGEQRFPFPEI
jgi:hypothetical protein